MILGTRERRAKNWFFSLALRFLSASRFFDLYALFSVVSLPPRNPGATSASRCRCLAMNFIKVDQKTVKAGINSRGRGFDSVIVNGRREFVEHEEWKNFMASCGGCIGSSVLSLSIYLFLTLSIDLSLSQTLNATPLHKRIINLLDLESSS